MWGNALLLLLKVQHNSSIIIIGIGFLVYNRDNQILNQLEPHLYYVQHYWQSWIERVT
jgi:hypothetical protein